MKSSVKYKKRKLKKSVKFLLVLAVFSAIGLFFLLNSDKKNQQDSDVLKPDVQDEFTHDYLNFPISLEEGNLVIESLFPFSRINPDASNEQGNDIAAIVLTNNSNLELKTASITLVMNDGNKVEFYVEMIPASKKGMAFSVDNLTLPLDVQCVDVQINAEMIESDDVTDVFIEVNGMNILLENKSTDSLNDLTIYYRDVFDDNYFGGKVYHETIDVLSAGETTEITANHSLLGLIEVVKISASK